jgi:hypothetical protein
MNKLRNVFAVALMALVLAVGGCATTKVDPNFAAQIEAYSAGQRAQADVAKAKADAERARYDAIAQIGQSGDAAAKIASVLALALGNGSNSLTSAPPTSQPLPAPPESGADKAFKWAALIAGPVTNVASGYFGYKLGVTQSNNATAQAIASTNAFAATATAGLSATTNVASSGFNAATGIATAGFNTATQGYGAATQIAALIQAPAANVTLSGQGVIGNGTYTGPVTRTCTGGSGASGSGGASGLTGSGGPSGTTGNAGSSGTAGNGGTAGSGAAGGTTGTGGSGGTGGVGGSSGLAGSSGTSGSGGSSGGTGAGGTAAGGAGGSAGC